jgi:uncharacterized protein (TIGR00297 family)
MSPYLLPAAGFLLNAVAALIALWRGWVDRGGAVSGLVVGGVIFAAGGPYFWLILMAFFLSSTLLGRVRREEKRWLEAVHEKGGKRDLFQVFANGGLGMIAAVIYRLTGDPAWAVGFAVSFASSNADTWASELGVLSRGAPISLLSFKPVPRGISGGVSLFGTAAALAGALFIALFFSAGNLLLGVFPYRFFALAAFIAAAGFLGSFVDSFLGATVQAQYVEDGRNTAGPDGASLMTERSRGEAGTPNRRVRGLAFVNNDAVNLASCASITLAAVLLARILL